MFELILFAVLIFLLVMLSLVMVLLFAKAKLSPAGDVTLTINGENKLKVSAGDTILTTLGNNKVFLPSACGGGGTCAMCKCQVNSGGSSILPTEKPYFSRKEIQDNWRLGCQVKVKNDMEIQIPEEIFGIKQWKAKVVSNYNVASFIKEFIVELPEDMHYEAGGYIQIEIPEGEVKYDSFDISAHPKEHPGEKDKFKYEWDKFNLWPLVMKNDESVVRAYSMASYPAEGRKIMLNVRIATPPWDRKNNNWLNVNPGIASSYIFGLKPGDEVTISGPYGEFFIKDTDSEMVYIGGGAGMAPLRSHLYHLFKTLKSNRKVSYWYGGRSRKSYFTWNTFAFEKSSRISNFTQFCLSL